MPKDKNTKPKSIERPIDRTAAGLRDAIFDEIDAIRGGKSNPTRANAIAKLANGIVETVRMEIEVRRFIRHNPTDKMLGKSLGSSRLSLVA